MSAPCSTHSICDDMKGKIACIHTFTYVCFHWRRRVNAQLASFVSPQVQQLTATVILLGTVLLLCPLASSFSELAVFGAAYGLVFGATVAIHITVLAEVVGVHRLGSALGFFMLIRSSGGLLGPPIAGERESCVDNQLQVHKEHANNITFARIIPTMQLAARYKTLHGSECHGINWMFTFLLTLSFQYILKHTSGSYESSCRSQPVEVAVSRSSPALPYKPGSTSLLKSRPSSSHDCRTIISRTSLQTSSLTLASEHGKWCQKVSPADLLLGCKKHPPCCGVSNVSSSPFPSPSPLIFPDLHVSDTSTSKC